MILCQIGLPEVHKAVGLLLETLGPLSTGLQLQKGIAHEILFLTMTVLGRDHVNIVDFNKCLRPPLTSWPAACTRKSWSTMGTDAHPKGH